VPLGDVQGERVDLRHGCGGLVSPTGQSSREEDSVMARNFYVVVKVPVRNLTADEAQDLQHDPLGFLTEYDLYDEATVESIQEVDGL
jgi:hypothetical protein